MTTRRHIANLAALLLGHSVAQAAGPLAPFEPVADAARPEAMVASAPSVQGLRTGRWPAALVGGRWLKPGEFIEAGRLVEVHRDGVVWLGSDGERKWIAWPAQTIAEPTLKDRP